MGGDEVWLSKGQDCRHVINGMTEAVNQQTLADQLGLSRATVSRCFTNHRGINPETRARVFDLAAQIGYRYMEPRMAVGRKAKGVTLGVLICYAGEFATDDLYENPGQKLLGGVSELALLREIKLDVHYVDPADSELSDPSYKKIAALRRAPWQGALLIYAFPRTIVDGLMARFPCVSLVEQYGRADLNCVDVDHYRGISKVMDLLVELGHRRIGFYSNQFSLETYWTMHRFSAYFAELLATGLPYRPDDVINLLPGTGRSEAEALRLMRERTADGVTAWVCVSDYSAYSVIGELTDCGAQVPEEVSVAGFDGISPPPGAPQATTLEIPFREVGITGARRLLDLNKAPFDPPQHILLGCQLRRGETVGPVPTKRLSPRFSRFAPIAR
jgi:LacI family transcriptional regulator